MPNLSLFSRYWYLWLTALVLVVAAATGFRESLFIGLGSLNLRMTCAGFLFGCALFLLGIGGIYVYLDYRERALVRWLKVTHLIFCHAFCLVVFIFMQILNTRRLTSTQGYFGGRQMYSEELYMPLTVFFICFFLVQFLFVVFLLRLLTARPKT